MNKFLLLFVFHFPILLVAQERQNLQFTHFTIDQGLSSSEVSEIVQDNKGFIWVGTEDGLNRFDSYAFKVYRKRLNDTASLSHNFISRLFVDSKGNLWVGTQHGLSLYNRDFDSFTNFYPDMGVSNIQSNFISSITEDQEHRLFISLKNGKIYMFDPDSMAFNEVLDLNNEIKYLFIDSDNLLWVLSDKINIYNKEFELVNTITEPLANFPFNCMVEDGDKYWISTLGSGLFWINKKSQTIIRSIRSDIYEDYIDILYKDRENNIWIGSSSSLKLYNREKDKFYYYRENNNSQSSLITSGVNSFLQDNAGNYWVLSKKGGINVSLVKKKFINLTPDEDSRIAITKRVISSLIVDSDDRLWAGFFHAGLDLIDFSKETAKHFENNPSNDKTLGSHSVLMLFEDSKNNIWTGTYRGGIQRYNNTTGTFTTYKHDPKNTQSICSNDIRRITEDKEGNLWLASCGSGLDKFNPETGIFTHYRQDKSNIYTGLVNDWLFTVLCDFKGDIWIGSSYGLGLLNKDHKTFTNYYNNPTDNTSLSNNYINYLFEDSKKNIWIGTNEGLNLFDRESKNFKVFMLEDGLPNNVIKGIQEDNNGYLWISTNKGISKLNPINNTFRNYDVWDGLASNEFNYGACSKNKKGQLFFGSNNGIVSFFPDSIKDNPVVPPVYITSFKILNSPIYVGQKNSPLTKDIAETEEIVLNYKQSSVFSFEFVLVSFMQSEKKQYAYKMEGFDKDWVYSDTKREATYTNLDPGKYVFRVKASNYDNVWNNNGTFIKLIILPPWWQSLWFKSISLILIVLILLLLYYIKIEQIRRKNIFLEDKINERTREIDNKNKLLISKTEELNNTNALLEERQQQIEKQTEELIGTNDQLSKSNTKLSELNSMKDKILSIIGHDLKNPISIILGFSELLKLKGEKLSSDLHYRYIGNIYDSAKKTYQLLESLLNWARSQNQLLKPNPVKIGINRLLMKSILLLRESALKKNIIVSSNGYNADAIVFCDSRMIETVLRNLISNALKFTPQKGNVDISWSINEHPGYCTIHVEDSGIGISEEQLSRLFNIEESVSTDGTDGETGTGLGLVLSKEFVEKNGGSIWVQSEVGNRSVFSFTIPLVSK